MSFRENMQHLRATRNMTQEQLAMLLGVSRQSVSKWEAERARRAKRESGTYAAVMCAATAVGLVLAFTPAAPLFLLAWPVGGIVCAAIKAFRSSRSSR